MDGSVRDRDTDQGVILEPERAPRWDADGFPEFPQFLDALLRRISSDQSRVHRADRNAGDPIGMQVCLGERLIDPGLVGAERAATLQQEGNSFERRALLNTAWFAVVSRDIKHSRCLLVRNACLSALVRKCLLQAK